MPSAKLEISIAKLEISIAGWQKLFANDAHVFASLEERFASVALRPASLECYYLKPVTGTGNTTVPSSTDDLAYQTPEIRLVSALVICWSAEEPSRIGEIAFLDDEVSSTWLLGRGAALEDDVAPRAVFVRPAPGRIAVDAGPLTGIAMSRTQLTIRVSAGALEVTSVGKPVLAFDGHPVPLGATRRIAPGTVVSIRNHSVFRYVLRPRDLPAGARDLPPHDFGGPDAHGIVGESHAAWTLRADIAAAARTRRHVIIFGETGTGKELAAHAIHRILGRRGDVVAFNASTITASLAESTLFGNARDYPNPHTPERPGLFGEAEGGTLFLDEIGELPVELQARLLRALEGAYTRLGDAKPRKANVLVVAATNRGPSAIKHDVLTRFGARIHMPSLADRIEDVPLLARALILEACRRNPDLAARSILHTADGRTDVNVGSALVLALLRASYDGNVRDLDNFLLAVMSRADDGPLMPPPDLRPLRTPPTMPPPVRDEPPDDDDIDGLLDGIDSEARRIRRKLEAGGWNVARAARSLGMHRGALIRMMKKHGIERP